MPRNSAFDSKSFWMLSKTKCMLTRIIKPLSRVLDHTFVSLATAFPTPDYLTYWDFHFDPIKWSKSTSLSSLLLYDRYNFANCQIAWEHADLFVLLCLSLLQIGFILSATVQSGPVRYSAMFWSVQVFCCVALTLAWVANISATESKRARAYTFLATIGQCGPLLGTNIVPTSQASYCRQKVSISAAFGLLVALLSMCPSFGPHAREHKDGTGRKYGSLFRR